MIRKAWQLAIGPPLAEQLATTTVNGENRTAQSYVRWLTCFIHFHNLQHPINMGDSEESLND